MSDESCTFSATQAGMEVFVWHIFLLKGIYIYMRIYGKELVSGAAYDVYMDIKKRTNGEIYFGVVGPVRTGKSTFIKRFMELCVLPSMKDDNKRKRAQDELPQSSGGTTVMTVEPKFIPSEAALISPFEGINMKVRLVDCVGFMVEGANGHLDNGKEREWLRRRGTLRK